MTDVANLIDRLKHDRPSRRSPRERRIRSAAGESGVVGVASVMSAPQSQGRRTRRAIGPGRAVGIARSAMDRDHRKALTGATTHRRRSRNTVVLAALRDRARPRPP